MSCRFFKIIVFLYFCFIVLGCGQHDTPVQEKKSVPQSNAKISELMDVVKKEEIYGLVLYHKDKLVVEYYKEGYDKDSKFQVYSCTKSVMATLIGIAMDKGLIHSTDQMISDFFPILNTSNDERKKQIRLHHLLNQTSGIQWSESGDSNSVQEMMRSLDWSEFVLNRPMEAVPGQRFNYNSGGSHLLSSIITKVSGQSTLSFAQNYLFAPMRITDISWRSDAKGSYGGGFGLGMTVRDMGKLGTLYLHNGIWEGKQLISSDWIRKTIMVQSEGNNGITRYGYQWWVAPQGPDRRYGYYYALGYGGQYIIVVPELQIVAVFTSWLPDTPDKPRQYFEQYILTAFGR